MLPTVRRTSAPQGAVVRRSQSHRATTPTAVAGTTIVPVPDAALSAMLVPIAPVDGVVPLRWVENMRYSWPFAFEAE